MQDTFRDVDRDIEGREVLADTPSRLAIHVRRQFAKPGEFGAIPVLLVSNATCPWIGVGTAGMIGQFRNDGLVKVHFGTDPGYIVVLKPECVRRDAQREV